MPPADGTTTMRALLSRQTGGPETLTVEEIDVPSPGIGEVQIAVEAASLNFMDTLIIRDRYQIRPARPFSPSGECAGRVVAVGEGVSSVQPGDRVIAYPGHGAARERVNVPAVLVQPIPEGVSSAVAASLVIAYGTSIHALADRGRLQPGETLVVTGATGGTGQAAVEIGRLMGARVIAVVGSSDKVAAAAALGAHTVVDASSGPLKEAIRDLTGGRGADVVYDAVGADLAEPLVRATGWGGRYLVIGFAGGDIPKIALNLVMLKAIDLVGVHWNGFVERHPEGVAAHVRRLLDWVAAGRLKPAVTAYPLEAFADAFAAIESRSVRGKVVLTP